MQDLNEIDMLGPVPTEAAKEAAKLPVKVMLLPEEVASINAAFGIKLREGSYASLVAGPFYTNRTSKRKAVALTLNAKNNKSKGAK